MGNKVALSDRHQHCVDSEEYDYGEYFRQCNLAEIIFDQVRDERLVQGIAKFFYENYREELSKGARKKCFRKAKSMVKSRVKDPGILTERYYGREGIDRVMREAVSYGYISNFRIDEPWHPRVFFDEESITTYPFQHQTAVLYSGQAKHVFFTREGKSDLLPAERLRSIREKGLDFENFRNPDSILEQGALRPGNQHVGDEDEYDRDARESGVWLAFLDKAKNYPAHDEGTRFSRGGSSYQDIENPGHEKLYDGSVVFEAEVPTDRLVVKGHKDANHGRLEDLDDCIRDYSSPIAMAEDFSRDEEFIVPNQEGELSLKFVTGVWDKGMFPKTPHFLSIQSMVNQLMSDFPGRMPNGSQYEPDQSRNNQLSNAQELFETINEIQRFSQNLENRLETIESKINDFESKLEEIDSSIQELEAVTEKLREEEKELESIEQKLDELKKKWRRKNRNLDKEDVEKKKRLMKEKDRKRSNLRELKSEKEYLEKNLESCKDRIRRYLESIQSEIFRDGISGYNDTLELLLRNLEEWSSSDLENITDGRCNLEKVNLNELIEKISKVQEDAVQGKQLLARKAEEDEGQEKRVIKRTQDAILSEVVDLHKLEFNSSSFLISAIQNSDLNNPSRVKSLLEEELI